MPAAESRAAPVSAAPVNAAAGLSWPGLVRLGLVQTAIGAIVVLATSTLSRIMLVELALPAMVPAALVAAHYVVQLLRLHHGHSVDVAGRCAPRIIAGMALLASGGMGAALAVSLMPQHRAAGIALAVLAYLLIGVGVGAAGTSNLALLTKRLAPARRPLAAALVWIMMILGFALSAGAAGHFLQPFSPGRLLRVYAIACGGALALALAALSGVERRTRPLVAPGAPACAGAAGRRDFRAACRDLRQDPRARNFTLFLLASMMAFSAQEWLLEPLAGAVFGFVPGQSARLAGLQNAGVLLGMLGVVGAALATRQRSLRLAQRWMVAGTIGSALFVALLAGLTLALAARWLPLAALGLGVSNGLFAVAALGVMMDLAAAGGAGREGIYMGLWGAAQAIAFAIGGLGAGAVIDGMRHLLGSSADAFVVLLGVDALLFVLASICASGRRLSAAQAATALPANAPTSAPTEATVWDCIVVGGGPAGATAAHELAQAGHRVLLLDRAGRIKPCGGAVPPRLLEDFDIPDQLVVARINRARMVSPTLQRVDMAIESGTVGMVDREVFDEWLRARAASAGCERRDGECIDVECAGPQNYRVRYRAKDADGSDSGPLVTLQARSVIGADGAASRVARQRLPGMKTTYVAAYHEIIRTPEGVDPRRCEVWYNGRISPDFYGWVFPHGPTLSVGVGSARKGFSLRQATTQLRAEAGLAEAVTLRREGAPIPLRPLRRWDDGMGAVLAGDAAGVVAPASGEGIYYAMYCGRLAAQSIHEFLLTADPAALRQARRRFMREHGRVFWILRMMQSFWYGSDARRERFVSICRDPDVQYLTWQAYLYKKLVRARPAAHARVFFKDLAHLLRLARV